MNNINKRYGKENEVKLKHIIHSFHREEKITPQEAQIISLEWYKAMFPNLDYVGIIATHVADDNSKDNIEKCIHSHISLNAISLNGERLDTNKEWIEKAIQVSNDLCKKHGLEHSFIDINRNSRIKKTMAEIKMEQRGKVPFKTLIKKDIDDLIIKVKSYEELLDELYKLGYDIKDGKELRIANEKYGMKKRMQTTRLGMYYSKSNLTQRIIDNNKLKITSIKLKSYIKWIPKEEYKVIHGKASLSNNIKLVILLLNKSLSRNIPIKNMSLNNKEKILEEINKLTKALKIVEENNLDNTESCYKCLSDISNNNNKLYNRKIKNENLLKQIALLQDKLKELNIKRNELIELNSSFVNRVKNKNKIRALEEEIKELKEYSFDDIENKYIQLKRKNEEIDKKIKDNNEINKEVKFVLEINKELSNKDKFKDIDRDR